MPKTLFTAAAALLFAASVAQASNILRMPEPETPQSLIKHVGDGNCGLYVITECSRGWKSARKAAAKYGGYAVNTNNFDGFRNGWKCAVISAFNKADAKRIRRRVRSQGARTAYYKWGCD